MKISVNLRMKVIILTLAVAMMLPVTLQYSYARDDQNPTEIVRNAYQDLLDREPDKSGMSTYRSHIIDDDWSRQRVREEIKKSSEYQNRQADQIIKRAYNDLLGRDPDNAGLKSYRHYIIDEGWSEKEVRRHIKQSEEYRNR